jgi:hypothetical protein
MLLRTPSSGADIFNNLHIICRKQWNWKVISKVRRSLFLPKIVPRHEHRRRKVKKICTLTNTAEKDKTGQETLEREINNYGKSAKKWKKECRIVCCC